MTLPNFIILGSQRCGTTSLYKYICEHPQVLSASQKELHFFNWHSKGEKKKGIKWYSAQFPQEANREGFLTGEASPDYIIDPHTPQKMFQLVPDVKLIAILRNPVDRAISHYNFNLASKKPDVLPLRQAIEKEAEILQPEIEKLRADENYRSGVYRRNSYLLRGVYVEQLKEWMKIFPKDNFLILKSEDLFENTGAIMSKVFDFLELPNYEVVDRKKYKALPFKDVEPELRQELVKYFKTHNQNLEKFLGRKFNWETSGSKEDKESEESLEGLERSLVQMEEKLNSYQLELQQMRSEINAKLSDRSQAVVENANKNKVVKKGSMKMKVTPWLTSGATEFLEDFVKQKPNAKVLEFGSGGSTIWLSKFLKQIVSIEHNKQWFTKVKNHIQKDKKCNSIDLRWLSRPYYKVCEEFPDEFFDFVLVDGRERVKCLEASIRVLKPGGILMLDDAEREKYEPGKQLLNDWQLTRSFSPSGKKHTYWWQKP